MSALFCRHHPEVPAVASCVSCGDLVCGACRQHAEDGRTLCPTCAPVELRLETAAPPPAPTIDISLPAAEPAAPALPPVIDLPLTWIPWEQESRLGTLGALYYSLMWALRGPIHFMNRIPWVRGDLRTPLIFALLAGIIGRVGDTALAMLVPADMLPANPLTAELGVHPAVARLLLMPTFPLAICLRLFLISVLAHGLLKLAGAARRPFEATFRVHAYAGVATMLLAVPLLGSIAEPFFSVILLLAGLRAAHGLTMAQALLGLLPTLAETMLVIAAVMG